MVRPNLTLEAEAGYVVYRSWDFFDQHINPTSHPVPTCNSPFTPGSDAHKVRSIVTQARKMTGEAEKSQHTWSKDRRDG
jgi:hypothetical protein